MTGVQLCSIPFFIFFFFNDTATTEIYTLSLHDALPIYNLVDRGVDAIIGHHPHVTQGVEIYKGKPIFYSLGNFIFDQNGDETTKGYAVSMVILEEVVEWEVKPYSIINTSPKFYGKETKDLVCEHVLSNVKNSNGCGFEVPI